MLTRTEPAPITSVLAWTRRWPRSAPATLWWCRNWTGSPAPCPTPAPSATTSPPYGIKLTLGGQVYDPTDPMGKLLFNILATFAEFQVDLLRLRPRKGMTEGVVLAPYPDGSKPPTK